MVGPKLKRLMVEHLRLIKKLSIRRSCGLIHFHQSSFYYKTSKQRDDKMLKEKLLYLSEKRIRYGFPRLLALLRREGIKDNHKRIERVYKELGLSIKKRSKKKSRSHLRLVLEKAVRPNQIWSMDFVSDSLQSKKRFRAFTLVDDFTRECPVIEVDVSLTGKRIVQVLNRLKLTRKLPKIIICDNGPEFISQVLDQWAYENKVEIKFIEPGNPVQNAFIESFNGRFRDECLNQHWFLNLENAKSIIEEWRVDYESDRPHSSLNYKTPLEFVREYEQNMLLANA